MAKINFLLRHYLPNYQFIFWTIIIISLMIIKFSINNGTVIFVLPSLFVVLSTLLFSVVLSRKNRLLLRTLNLNVYQLYINYILKAVLVFMVLMTLSNLWILSLNEALISTMFESFIYMAFWMFLMLFVAFRPIKLIIIGLIHGMFLMVLIVVIGQYDPQNNQTIVLLFIVTQIVLYSNFSHILKTYLLEGGLDD